MEPAATIDPPGLVDAIHAPQPGAPQPIGVPQPIGAPDLRPPLRADAERNRSLILDAARLVFAERGLDASLDEVAQRAGLGVGTVYRRFRDKSALVEALFDDDLASLLAAAEEALAITDPWDALATFLERSFTLQSASCGLRDLVSSTSFGRERVAAIRERLEPVVATLLARAEKAGVVRGSLSVNDVVCMGVMLGTVVDFSRCAAPGLWRRYLAVMLDGLRAGNASGPIAEPPLTDDQLDAAMALWRPHRR